MYMHQMYIDAVGCFLFNTIIGGARREVTRTQKFETIYSVHRRQEKKYTYDERAILCDDITEDDGELSYSW